MGTIMHNLAIALACLFGWFIFKELRRWYRYGPPKGIPSPPMGIPVIGHTLQVIRAGPSRFKLVEAWAQKYCGPKGIMMVRLPTAENGYGYMVTDLAVCAYEYMHM